VWVENRFNNAEKPSPHILTIWLFNGFSSIGCSFQHHPTEIEPFFGVPSKSGLTQRIIVDLPEKARKDHKQRHAFACFDAEVNVLSVTWKIKPYHLLTMH